MILVEQKEKEKKKNTLKNLQTTIKVFKLKTFPHLG